MAERSRQFLRRKAIERIVSEIYGDLRFTDGNGYQAILSETLSATVDSCKCFPKPITVPGATSIRLGVVDDPDDLAYYQHRAAGLLSHKGWQDRNLGVKLIGLTSTGKKSRPCSKCSPTGPL